MDVGDPELLWGIEPGEYTNFVKAESTTYGKDELCGGTATTVRELMCSAYCLCC